MRIPKTKFPGILLALAVLCTFATISPVSAQENSPLSYIDANKDLAITYMQEYGLPASIILAVAMHESAHGTSKIARHLNNHFGIKGKNNSTVIRSSYKGYETVEASYEDFIICLKTRRQFKDLFGKYSPDDYRNWARGIARGGYARSRSWASQVIGMIEKYRLHQYDSPAGESAANNPLIADEMAAEQAEAMIYAVQKGDTLSQIARQYGTTVKSIRKKNGLSSSRLQIGQKLVL